MRKSFLQLVIHSRPKRKIVHKNDTTQEKNTLMRIHFLMQLASCEAIIFNLPCISNFLYHPIIKEITLLNLWTENIYYV